MQDSIQTIFRSARQFFSGTMISRVTGLIRDIATAYAFGADSSIAAFLVAFRFSHLFRRILGEGALQGAFTPQFENLRNKDPLLAAEFFRDLNGALATLLLMIVIFLGSLLGITAWSGNLSAGNTQIAYLTALLMPGLIFICLFGLNAGLLQCEKRYVLSSTAPALLNIGWTAGVLSLQWLTPVQAMPWLALCVVGATILQWSATIPACLDIVEQLSPSINWWKFNIHSDSIRNIVKPMLLTIAGVAATQVNSALDAIFARYADLEGPAYLWYAIRLQQLPLALFGIAIANAILPPLARAAREGDNERFDRFIAYTWKATLALMLPITIGIFLFGHWAIALIFGHGGFDEVAIDMTELCLQGYAIGLIPSALVICHIQGCFARKNYRLPMIASLSSVLCNLALNVWFVFGMGWGSASIALATGISSWVNLLVLCMPEKKVAAVLEQQP